MTNPNLSQQCVIQCQVTYKKPLSTLYTAERFLKNKKPGDKYIFPRLNVFNSTKQ